MQIQMKNSLNAKFMRSPKKVVNKRTFYSHIAFNFYINFCIVAKFTKKYSSFPKNPKREQLKFLKKFCSGWLNTKQNLRHDFQQ